MDRDLILGVDIGFLRYIQYRFPWAGDRGCSFLDTAFSGLFVTVSYVSAVTLVNQISRWTSGKGVFMDAMLTFSLTSFWVCIEN